MIDRFLTNDARTIILNAKSEMKNLFHKKLCVEHILLSILAEKGLVANKLFLKFGLDYNRFRKAIIDFDNNKATDYNKEIISNGVRHIYNSKYKETMTLFKTDKIDSNMLSFMAINDSFDAVTIILQDLNFDIRRFSVELINAILNNKRKRIDENDDDYDEGVEDSINMDSTDQFVLNMTERASENKYDPVIGREKEINKLIEILSRRNKNNPCLIGEPGVGKTSIVEGLAQKIVDGDVPSFLLDKEIYLLNINSMIAGTQYRGMFEERAEQIFSRFKNDDNAILFIDEIHNVVGAGSTEDSTGDLANILKPYIQNGEIKLIGATTTKEYQKFIEKDPALDRRLQSIIVNEPSVEDTISILIQIKKEYESFHDVRISDEIIKKIVYLTERYIPNKFFPDKAIDILDEVMSKIKIKNSDNEYVKLSNELKKLYNDKLDAISNYEFDQADSLNKMIEESEKKLIKYEKIKSKVSISLDDVLKVIAEKTGIPVEKMDENEKKQIQSFKHNLEEKIIGQTSAIDLIDKAIKRSKSGINDPNKPIASFLFVGPTGVGKSYLAKRIGYELFGDEKKITSIDMSEFNSQHSYTKLIGSEPGYVGYDEGGILTNSLKTNPYQVILFDEIEKAHPKIFDLFLQILDEGRIKDGQGRDINFKNTIIIMTSNAGTSYIRSKNSLGFGQTESNETDAVNKKINKAIKEIFKPEFINRLDEVVIFEKLNRDNIEKIIELEIDKIKERVKDVVKFKTTKNFNKHILDKSYSDIYGARAVKRELTKTLENFLSEYIIDHNDLANTLIIDYVNDEINVINEESNETKN